LQAVVIKAMHLLGIEPFSLDGETHSTLPIGAGLGSSATLCVAVLRALSEALNIKITPTQLADFANELEKSFHGNPSGLDAAVVAFERPILFAKAKAIEIIPIASKHSYEFVLIDSNIRASTMSMIRIAQPYFTGHLGEQRLARFDELSLLAHESLKTGDIDTLAMSMNENGDLLAEAGVVPHHLKDMIVRARELGALAAKTTGAGGGGVIIGLLHPERSEDHYRQITEQFKGHGIYRVTLNNAARDA
jgi:mevalonate kinase